MTRRSLIAPLAAARRGILALTLSLALAGLLLPSAAGQVPPVRQAAPVERNLHANQADPSARLEFEIYKILIHDDQDWGEGEINIQVTIWEVTDACPGGFWRCKGMTDILRSADIQFGENDDKTVPLNRVVLGTGDFWSDPSIGPGIGFPV